MNKYRVYNCQKCVKHINRNAHLSLKVRTGNFLHLLLSGKNIFKRLIQQNVDEQLHSSA
jgi:hypothetical protein